MSNGGTGFMDEPPVTVTVSDVTEAEVNFREQAKQQALGQSDAGVYNSLWAARAAHISDAPAAVISIITGFVDVILAEVVKLLTAAQGEKNSSFYDLAAAALHDLTGVEIDAAALKNSSFGSGRLAGMEKFGGDLYDILEQEFKPTSGDLEVGDTSPAKKFLGFLMNFAIRQGNIETILSMIPEEYRIVDGAREYGELMAKNLGLGRMARRALQPLIQILVADPLMYQLQQTYRPKRIGAGEAIKDYFRGAIELADLQRELAQEGYSDTRQTRLMDAARPLVGERELIRIMFRRGLTQADLTPELSKRGFTDNAISNMIEAERPFLEKNEIAVLYTNGVITHELASTYMGKLGFDNDTAELVLQAHSLQHQHAHRLGLAELKKAFHNNVIDLLELKAHLSGQGYSDDDIQIVTLDLLAPATGKVRQLSLAEIKAGFKAGVLTAQQAHDHLKALGYSDADVAVIIATLPVPKPPATPAAPTA